MAHVSHRLKGPFAGALAGGGDPATSPLYVFGPFLKLLAVSGVAAVSFGASIWLVTFTVIAVAATYRKVMQWVTDGSGGSGLCEEELGPWAVKINAAITFIEYTLTFLVSIAALVTFVADRAPALGGHWTRVALAIAVSTFTAVVVNRGPRTAARVFGPATAAVLLLLAALVVATIAKRGLVVPRFDWRAFGPTALPTTLGGYVRLLALMTGIEVFANLVAAYDGAPQERARKAFSSLVIIMASTVITMLVVGPAIFDLADPHREDVSVFTQAMDALLPAPLPYVGTLIGIVVLLSAGAASAQGLQNLALGLRYRHYLPAAFGERNRFDVAPRPVWLELGVASVCFVLLGTNEETYLSLYAAGVFILLSLTGVAVVKRLLRELADARGIGHLVLTAGAMFTTLLTTGAAVMIFVERTREGAWAYFVLVPLLYAGFTVIRRRLGPPADLQERLGRTLGAALPNALGAWPQRPLVVVDGSRNAEAALLAAVGISARFNAPARLCVLSSAKGPDLTAYGQALARLLEEIPATEQVFSATSVDGVALVAKDLEADLIVGSAEIAPFRDLAGLTAAPVLLVRADAPATQRYTLFERVVIGIDGSEAAEVVLPYARTFASAGAAITLVVVAENESDGGAGADSPLHSYAARLTKALEEDGAVNLEVRAAGPTNALISAAESADADLVLVATHGKGGVARASRVPLGSVPSRLAEKLERPLLIVPSSP